MLSRINIGQGNDHYPRTRLKNWRSDRIPFDTSKPDGTTRKPMDVRRIESLGWRPQVWARDGLGRAYADLPVSVRR